MKGILTTFLVGFSVIVASPILEDIPNVVTLNNMSGHDIIDGNCSNLNDADLVFQDHIHLHRVPFMTRSGESEWHGDKVIYCVKALNQKSDATGGSANVTEGGVGHSFVTVKMESYKSHGIEFFVYVWAK